MESKEAPAPKITVNMGADSSTAIAGLLNFLCELPAHRPRQINKEKI
jgi:hypothetical protein